jgi:hypothetical protein
MKSNCCTKINPKLEGKTALLKNPHPPHSLAFAAWVIARLGGWKHCIISERLPCVDTAAMGCFFMEKMADRAFRSVPT